MQPTFWGSHGWWRINILTLGIAGCPPTHSSLAAYGASFQKFLVMLITLNCLFGHLDQMQAVGSLQKHFPLHFEYHTCYEVWVELHRVDMDLSGLEMQREATGPHSPHMQAQQIVGKQLHVYVTCFCKAGTRSAIVCPSLLCWRLVDQKCVGLPLGSLFCSIDSDVYFYANTTPFWFL